MFLKMWLNVLFNEDSSWLAECIHPSLDLLSPPTLYNGGHPCGIHTRCIFIIQIIYFLGVPSKIIPAKNHLNSKSFDHLIDGCSFNVFFNYRDH